MCGDPPFQCCSSVSPRGSISPLTDPPKMAQQAGGVWVCTFLGKGLWQPLRTAYTPCGSQLPLPLAPSQSRWKLTIFFKKIKHCYFIVFATAVLLAMEQGCWMSKPKLFKLLHPCRRQSSLYQRQSWGCHCVWTFVWVTVSKQYEKIQSEKKIRILTVEWFFSQLLWFGSIWEEISSWMKSHILIGENHSPPPPIFLVPGWGMEQM